MCAEKGVNLDDLIAIEWDMLQKLKDMLGNPELSMGEKTRMANAIGYHASILNKLLNQKGENSQFNEETLGDYIQKYADGGMRRLVRREFRVWTRKLSLRK
jgi:hypothetical protein